MMHPPPHSLMFVALLSFVAACESKGEQSAEVQPAATQSAKPVVTEPPPDPNRNNYKKPTVQGSVSFASFAP